MIYSPWYHDFLLGNTIDLKSYLANETKGCKTAEMSPNWRESLLARYICEKPGWPRFVYTHMYTNQICAGLFCNKLIEWLCPVRLILKGNFHLFRRIFKNEWHCVYMKLAYVANVFEHKNIHFVFASLFMNVSASVLCKKKGCTSPPSSDQWMVCRDKASVYWSCYNGQQGGGSWLHSETRMAEWI